MGANIGTVAVSLLVRHGVERIVAVEPDEENVRLLRANLALNGVQDRVEIHQIALSDTDGTLVLESSTEQLRRSPHSCRRARVGPISTTRDSARPPRSPRAGSTRWGCRAEIDLEDIDLVWMDAQGHEAHILAGAERLAAAGTPIVTEYWPYGLRRAGALERFHALVAERYSVVVDLREPTVAIDAKDVADLADRYAPEPGQRPVRPLHRPAASIAPSARRPTFAVPAASARSQRLARAAATAPSPGGRRPGSQKTGVSV